MDAQFFSRICFIVIAGFQSIPDHFSFSPGLYMPQRWIPGAGLLALAATQVERQIAQMYRVPFQRKQQPLQDIGKFPDIAGPVVS